MPFIKNTLLRALKKGRDANTSRAELIEKELESEAEGQGGHNLSVRRTNEMLKRIMRARKYQQIIDWINKTRK